ncbi:MAG: hypothetical protein WC089_01710 [Candidatus Paceibacterota bacterium]
MKTFFIVPGFKMKATDREYRWLITFLKDNGFRVVAVPVHWNHKTLSQNAEAFIEFYNKNKSDLNYILGFSYGSVITFITASILKPRKIFLCSLSPDFAEDRLTIDKNSVRDIGKKRFDDVRTRSSIKFAKELEVPTVLFYGEKEGTKYPQLKKRAEETFNLVNKSKLIIVKNASHKIDFPEYVDAIKKELMSIF